MNALLQPSTLCALDQYRVLVLEDDAFQREVLSQALRRMGIRHIDKAENGAEALAFFDTDNQCYDIVLCDLHHQDPFAMDGVEFIRAAHHGRIGSWVLISALHDDMLAASELLAKECGNAFVTSLRKPVNPDGLRAVLEKCAPHRQVGEKIMPWKSRQAWTKGDLRSAIRKEQIVPFFHPKVCLKTGVMAGAEVLARWKHPDLGILSPSAFMPLIEKKQLMPEMTESLFRQVLPVIKDWTSQGVSLPVAINASPITLQDASVPNRWRRLVDDAGADPASITIEITETASVDDVGALLETVTRLRMHGFAVSLDDFGTSFSSLQQLIELPINELKIDRSFVIQAPSSGKVMLVFDLIINLARSMNLRTVAEGIESEELADMVRMSGCDVGQGYLFAKPMTANDLWAWHQSHYGVNLKKIVHT